MTEKVPLEYRQYVPPEKATDAKFYDQVVRDVRENLSMITSESDNPNEYAGEVVIDTRSSRKGGFWVHGSINRPLAARYATAVVLRSEFEFHSNERAIDHAPVDLSPEEYALHLERKRRRGLGDDQPGNAQSDVSPDLLKGGGE